MESVPIQFMVMQYFCLLFSLCIHEASHAAMANWCGDPSARLLGRITMDPRKHIDPLGTVIMPILMMISSIPFLVGWAKPVPFNPRNLKNMRRDPVLIAMAGPGSNIIVALCGVLVLRVLLILGGIWEDNAALDALVNIFFLLVMINLLLALFNVIPVPPLDGHYVLHYFLPPGGQRVLEQIGPFGIIIAIFLARPWLGWSMPIAQNMVFKLLTFGVD